MRALAVIAAILGAPACADTVIAARTIRANSPILAADVTLQPVEIAGAATDPAQVVGQEARVTLYAGRPVRLAEVGPPALIERNQIVTLSYVRGGLQIFAEGRALSRAGLGDRIRVMNLSSRSSVFGDVLADGSVQVQQ